MEQNESKNKVGKTLKENDVIISFEDDIFDENGKHKLEKFKNKIKTELKIDFFDERVKVFLTIPVSMLKEKTLLEQGARIIIKNNRKYEKIIDKFFKISNANSIITIDNNEYYISTFFNKKMLENHDTKTYEMIFYDIFKDEIYKKLKDTENEYLIKDKKGD